MKGNLKQALENVDMLYEQIVSISDDIVNHYTKELNDLIDNAKKNIYTLTSSDLQTLMLQISFLTFQFCEVKDKAISKANGAETLKEEAYAKELIVADGAIALKQSTARLNISDEIIAEAIHDLVSSSFKSKLDEAHRLVDSIKSALITRAQEQKFGQQNISIGNVGENTYITE